MLNTKKTIFFIFIFALFIRLFYVLAVPQLSLAGSDAKEYDLAAESLLRGEGFAVERLSGGQVEIVRPPLFPLMLAGMYAIFGHNYTVARILQAILAAFCTCFIYYFAKGIFKKESVAITSSLLYCVYPALIAYTGLLYSETTYIFFLLIALYFLNRAIKTRGVLLYILTGVFLGIATMISSRSLYMVIFILLGLLLVLKDKFYAFKGASLIFLLMMIVFSPWTIRNYFVSEGQFIILENYSSATALWLATNPQGQILEWNYEKEPLKSLVGNLPIEERTPVIRKEAVKNLKKYPLAYVRNSFKRFFVLLIAGHSNCFQGLEESMSTVLQQGNFMKLALKIFLLAFNMLIIILGFIGIYFARRQWRECLVLLVPVFYTLSVHTLYVAAPRLQIPMLPFLIIFASYAMVTIFEKFNNPKIGV